MSTKNTLSELLQFGLVQCNDKLVFLFKGHEFSCILRDGGILCNCTWKQNNSITDCFMDRPGFTSLTDWCDSCIQELLSEYVTRFSSWKRVKHQKTGAPMAMLRARIQELKPAVGRVETIATLEQDLLRERRRNTYLMERIRLLENASQRQPDAFADDNPFRLQF